MSVGTVAVLVFAGVLLAVGLGGSPLLTWYTRRLIDRFEREQRERRREQQRERRRP